MARLWSASVTGETSLVPQAKVALSTASVYPESCTAAFEYAARLGYDGIEIMVWTDPVSQSIEALQELSERFAVPVVAVHTPCLLITQRVWTTDPWTKLRRSTEMAHALGAPVVVVHPPFRWQRDYARQFVEGIRRMAQESGVAIAVENMYPWKAGAREMRAYLPGWDPTEHDYDALTLDLSHTATSGSDAVDMLTRMGERFAHLHLADGSGSGRDEHLVPGRGTQPCGQVLERLSRTGFSGAVVLEISTRKVTDEQEREADLAASLAFARKHLAGAAREDSA